MSDKLPFKRLILGISRVADSRTSRKKFGNLVSYEITCEISMA